MRRLLLLFLSYICYHTVFATTKTWVGSSGSNWNNVSNWSPAGVPASADDVIFNSSVTVTIDLGLSPLSLNSLHFTNNTTVLFQTNETSNFRLFSTSTANPALLIDAGSTFTFDGTNISGTNSSTLNLTVATGCIGSIYGTLNISCTGAASGGTNLDTYTSPTAYGIVTVYTGGKIRILPNAANTGSSLTPVPTLVMQSGSTYENLKNGGSFPDGTWDANSLARALSPGTIAPIFNGTNYGNLEWNCSAQGAFSLGNSITFNNVNFISTNKNNISGEFRIKTGTSAGINTMTINGNLDVGTDARLVTSSPSVTAGNGGSIQVKGNINNQGTITSNGITTTLNNFTIAGTTNQTFSNTGIFAGTNLLLTMSNPAGLTLLTPFTLPWNADFTSGKIFTTSINVLTMVDNATYINASANSFVEGPLKKIGDEDFIFPVGVGSIYAPISATGGSGATTADTFTAQYLRTNPQTANTNAVQPGMNHISYVEYWKLNQGTGTIATKNVSLAVTYTSFCYDLTKTYVSRWSPSALYWTNESTAFISGPSSPPYVSGTITTNNPLPAFGDFTLITDLTFNTNPLPVKLISFNAVKNNNASVINWELATCCSAAARFEVEKSTDARNYSLIVSIKGDEYNRFYTTADTRLAKGITYYRLKMIDYDGKISYSNTIAVLNNTEGIILASLIPTIVQTSALLSITSSKEQKMELIITDIMGRLVFKQGYILSNGNTTISLSMENFKKGIYQLTGISTMGKTNVIRFVKE